MQGNETQEVIQIIELSGRGMAFLMKGGIGTVKLGGKLAFEAGKGAGKAAKWGSAKKMQHRLKCHFASKGKHSDLSLKDMEKLTGGNYGLYKIPLEDGANPEELKDFFKALKIRKIAFTEMPDLNVGDGYTEIAYNPVDGEKLRSFLEGYKFPDGKKAMETNFDDYSANATPEGERNLTLDAVANVQKEEQKKNNAIQRGSKSEERKNEYHYKNGDEAKFDLFAGCHDKDSIKIRYKQLVKNYHPDLLNGDKDSFQYVNEAYEKALNKVEQHDKVLNDFKQDCRINDHSRMDGVRSITIDKGLIVKETDISFITKVPGKDGYIVIQKSQSQIINNGKTIKTYLNPNQEYRIYDKSGILKKSTLGKELQKSYDPIQGKVKKDLSNKKVVKPIKLRK